MKMKMKEAKDSKKKNLKFLKDLSLNLSSVADSGCGLDFSQLQSDRVSEAADIILKRLEELKAEEEGMAAMNDKDSSCSSESESSESSESSDSECGDMKRVRRQQAAEHLQSAGGEEVTQLQTLATTKPSEESKCSTNMNMKMKKRVEVCMGNKCKKSGSAALMEEFGRQMAEFGEGEVVGCKCMGKCRSAPNVRVNNDSISFAIGFQDVTAIVATLLPQHTTNDFGFPAAV